MVFFVFFFLFLVLVVFGGVVFVLVRRFRSPSQASINAELAQNGWTILQSTNPNSQIEIVCHATKTALQLGFIELQGVRWHLDELDPTGAASFNAVMPKEWALVFCVDVKVQDPCVFVPRLTWMQRKLADALKSMPQNLCAKLIGDFAVKHGSHFEPVSSFGMELSQETDSSLLYCHSSQLNRFPLSETARRQLRDVLSGVQTKFLCGIVASPNGVEVRYRHLPTTAKDWLVMVDIAERCVRAIQTSL